MKKTLMTAIILALCVAMSAKGTAGAKPIEPEFKLSWLAPLFHGEKPEKLFKGLNMKKYSYYFYKEGGMLTKLAYGRHVKTDEGEASCGLMVPLTDDAIGVNYCDVGGGNWTIVFKNPNLLEAYHHEALSLGYKQLTRHWRQEPFGDRKILVYYKLFDEETADCIYIYDMNGYYRMDVSTVWGYAEDWPVVTLQQMSNIDNTSKEPLVPRNELEVMPYIYTIDGDTLWLHARNYKRDVEEMSASFTGDDGFAVANDFLEYTDKTLTDYYLAEAKALGYQCADTAWVKANPDEGFIRSLYMYKNADGLWGGWYGDGITFYEYDDHVSIMPNCTSRVNEPEATKQPPVTIADLIQLAEGRTTQQILQQRIDNQTQGTMEFIGNTLSIKGTDYVKAYELEARKLGFLPDNSNGCGRWNFIGFANTSETYQYLYLYKDGKPGGPNIHFNIENSTLLEISYYEKE